MPSLATEHIRFDHLVLMLRDQIESLSTLYEQDRFHLTPYATHNLGSMNRLITLDSTYIELLGWPTGTAPQRKEIAQQSLGLDALVLQTHDAQATYTRLKTLGFDVNPVQRLTRPVHDLAHDQLVEFDTVRFATQPIPGLRIYFCQHLRPELTWHRSAQQHANGATHLHSIVLKATCPQTTAKKLSQLCGLAHQHVNNEWLLPLDNCTLHLQASSSLAAEEQAVIDHAVLGYASQPLQRFNTHLSPSHYR